MPISQEVKQQACDEQSSESETLSGDIFMSKKISAEIRHQVLLLLRQGARAPEFRPAFWQKSQQLRAGAGFSMNQKSVSNLGDQLDVRLRFELAGEAQAVLDGCEKIDAHN